MTTLIIRNLSEATRRALRARAKRHARSTEAEVRAIIEDAVRPPKRINVGTLLKEFGQKHGEFRYQRDDFPATAAEFK
ncbi:MAG: FitA-like ribbon-helix-helix domain-containing protein [Aestuariivirga sp.]